MADTPNPEIREPNTEELTKSDLFAILSIGFSYPDEPNLSELKHLISDFVGCIPPNTLSEHLNEISRLSDPVSLQREYSNIFLRGTVPVSESSYSKSLNIIPDVSAYYRAFGMQAKTGDSPDSLGYELQFMSLLSLKSALAKTKEEKEIAEDACKSFLNDHLLSFAVSCSAKLRENTTNEFYLSLAAVLEYVLTC